MRVTKNWFKSSGPGSMAIALAILAFSHSAKAVGTWQKIPANPGTGAGSQGFWVMTDGSVLSTAQNSYSWARLVPDATGSYVKGKWVTVPQSSYGRGAAQQYVLKDGRFYIAGGEYLYQWPGCGANCYAAVDCNNKNFATAEIYDPVANSWSVVASAPNVIGDTGSALLSDGRILDSTNCGTQIQIYDPAANTWTASGNQRFAGDESSWANLLNGGVLAVGSSPGQAAVYNPTTKVWTATGAWPAGAKFVGCCGGVADSSGIATLFDGRVMAFTNPNVMIYTPGATASDAGTWASGPAMLNGDDGGDEFTDTEPNGKVLVTTNPFNVGPDMIEEYDPATNAFTNTNIPNVGCGCTFMNLPNGQVLVTGGDGNYVYTPDSEPNDAWRPTVSSVTYDSGSATYTLTGTQLSGLINGADEGDDMKLTANYPIVTLQDTTGKVYFARSFNFSLMVPQQGSATQTCQFTTPTGLPAGSYSLFVSSVGVKSKTALAFTVGMGGVGTGSTGSSGAGGTTGAGGASAGGGTSAGGSTSSTGGTSAGGTSAGGSTSSTGGTSTGGITSAAAGSTGVGGGTGVGGASSGSAGSNSTGTSGSSAVATGGSSSSADTGGCGCHVGSKAPAQSRYGALLALLGLGLLARRRRATDALSASRRGQKLKSN